MGFGAAPARAVLDFRCETCAEEVLTPALTHRATRAANANTLREDPLELSPRLMYGPNVFCLSTLAMLEPGLAYEQTACGAFAAKKANAMPEQHLCKFKWVNRLEASNDFEPRPKMA